KRKPFRRGIDDGICIAQPVPAAEAANNLAMPPDGRVAGTWGAVTRPLSQAITREVETLLSE
ncbi:hypothetical protein ABIE58_004074, partial [Roseovarius sp. MBR-78]